jgi:diaminopimelate epimerase
MIIFAKSLSLTTDESNFLAIDGEHTGKVERKGDSPVVSLKMKDVTVTEMEADHLFMDTGSPHYVVFKKNVEDIDLIREARLIRFNERFSKQGTNVDFVEIGKNELFVRSYERGVENETLSCGTGVTASALAFAVKNPHRNSVIVQTRGGWLSVSFRQDGHSFTDIWLKGPVQFVFQGEVEV